MPAPAGRGVRSTEALEIMMCWGSNNTHKDEHQEQIIPTAEWKKGTRTRGTPATKLLVAIGFGCETTSRAEDLMFDVLPRMC